MSTCELTRCMGDGVAVAVVTAGCVHEHVRTRAACTGCLFLLRENAAACGRCWDADCFPCRVRLIDTKPLVLS